MVGREVTQPLKRDADVVTDKLVEEVVCAHLDKAALYVGNEFFPGLRKRRCRDPDPLGVADPLEQLLNADADVRGDIAKSDEDDPGCAEALAKVVKDPGGRLLEF